MGYKEILARLMKDPLPPEMPFADVRLVMERCGYALTESGSSHVVFRKKGCNPISIPRRKGQSVKKVYLKKIRERLEEC